MLLRGNPHALSPRKEIHRNDKRLQVFLLSITLVHLRRCSTGLDSHFDLRDDTLQKQSVRLSNSLDAARVNMGKDGTALACLSWSNSFRLQLFVTGLLVLLKVEITCRT